MTRRATPKAIVFITTTRAFMMSHRENLIVAAVKKGLAVTLITGTQGEAEMERDANALLQQRYPDVRLVQSETIGLKALFFSISAFWHCLRHMPDIVHIVSIKMFLLCALWLPFLGGAKRIVSISGFGSLGVKRSGYLRKPIDVCIQAIILFLFRVQRATAFICQNQTDLDFVKHITARSCSQTLILGSGVDLTRFAPQPFNARHNRVLFVGRVLKDKGILEFVEAAKRLHRQYPDWEFQVIGSAGYDNPMALSKKEFNALLEDTNIIWNGFQADVLPLLESAKIVCLPSYREGFPKVLIEGAAAGCCLVATRVPGCVDAISDGIDGLLCAPRDVDALVYALKQPMGDATLAAHLAQGARSKALVQYDISKVTQTHLEIYGLG